MDPVLILASLTALMQSVQTWYQVKDSRLASLAFSRKLREIDERSSTGRVSEGAIHLQAQARQLTMIVPKQVLDKIGERLEKCWTRYHEVLSGDFLPAEIDEATQSVKRCVCRELNRMYELSG